MYFEKMAVKEKHTSRNENFINRNIVIYLSSPDHHMTNETGLCNKISRFSCGEIEEAQVRGMQRMRKIYIQGVTGGTGQTSGGCSLC
jgi:hypothetical protein